MRVLEGTVRWRRPRRFVAAGLAVFGVLATGVAADAGEPPAFSIVFPAGLACPTFDLRIDGFGDGPKVFRTFSDRDGNIVRTLTAGTGFALVFINDTTHEAFPLRANGAVTRTTFNPDGSQTQVLTGHNIVILFPADAPPGPSTTLHVGRVVIDIDAAGTFTVRQHSGTALDICAELEA